jgi:hypothetical protein
VQKHAPLVRLTLDPQMVGIVKIVKKDIMLNSKILAAMSVSKDVLYAMVQDSANNALMATNWNKAVFVRKTIQIYGSESDFSLFW